MDFQPRYYPTNWAGKYALSVKETLKARMWLFGNK